MALDFAALKSMGGNTMFLRDELNKAYGQQSDSSKDERFWYPAVDKAGNGYAVIRFLPAAAGETVPFVRIFEHGFKGPTGTWYIEKSRTTLGAGTPDPVSELNNQLWNSGIESDKDIARKQKRKLIFISNILVMEDSLNPENNGKVFLFKYGKKLYDKILEAMKPPFDDMGRTPDNANYNPTNAFNPFDFWEGANFQLKVRNVAGYRNYDTSNFMKAGPLYKDDAMLEALWKTEYSLSEFTDPSTFKSYEELKARLNRVLNVDSPAAARKSASTEKAPWEDNDVAESPKFKASKAAEIPTDNDDDDDDGLEFFKNLASR